MAFCLIDSGSSHISIIVYVWTGCMTRKEIKFSVDSSNERLFAWRCWETIVGNDLGISFARKLLRSWPSGVVEVHTVDSKLLAEIKCNGQQTLIEFSCWR
jgi:hypothetical protein